MYSALTAQVVATQTFTGGTPAACQRNITTYSGAALTINGDPPRRRYAHNLAEFPRPRAVTLEVRDLFTQQPVGTDIWVALAWCVGILIVAYVFAMITYRRKIA